MPMKLFARIDLTLRLAGLVLLALPAVAAAQMPGLANDPTAPQPAPAAPIALLPHRAVYDLSLGQEVGTGGIAALRGRMVYEFTGAACEGYGVNFRFVTDITDTEGGRRVSDLRSTSFEGGAGESFRFLTQNFLDNKMSEEVKGSAERNEDGSLDVTTTAPAKKSVSSQGPVLLPTEHLIETIAKARAGERFFDAPIFDGSENGDKFFATASVIGPAAAPKADDPELAAIPDVFRQLPTWPVALTYFDTSEGAGELTPVYKLSFDLYDNGVSRGVSMDYGDLIIDARLVELQLLDTPACARAK